MCVLHKNGKHIFNMSLAHLHNKRSCSKAPFVVSKGKSSTAKTTFVEGEKKTAWKGEEDTYQENWSMN